MNLFIYYCPDGNVNQLLPLVEEYQILAVKKKCEEFLLTKTGSMELLITGTLFVNLVGIRQCTHLGTDSEPSVQCRFDISCQGSLHNNSASLPNSKIRHFV